MVFSRNSWRTARDLEYRRKAKKICMTHPWVLLVLSLMFSSVPWFTRSQWAIRSSYHVGVVQRLPTTCGGLHVVTSYCIGTEHHKVEVKLATAHVAWVSDTPFEKDEAWCVGAGQAGTFLETTHHKSRCVVPAVVNNTVSIFSRDGIQCSFQCTWKSPRALPGITVLTQMRNPTNIEEWIRHHFEPTVSLMNNLVIYDDCSSEPILAQVESANINHTYFIEKLPDFCEHKSRQFVAMQDFLYRFDPEWVIQMDNDCYFDKNEELEKALSNDSIDKIIVSSAFYGACLSCSDARISAEITLKSHKLEGGLCALKRREPGESILSLLGARQSPPDVLLDWNLTGQHKRIRGDLRFARGRSIIAGMGQTHDWLSVGDVFEIDKDVYHFKHVKLFPLQEYLEKCKADAYWESVKPIGDPVSYWERIANYVCKDVVY